MTRSLRPPCHSARHGSMTVEILVAGTLLVTVMVTLLPFLARVSEVNKEISERELSLRLVREIVTELQANPSATPQLPESFLKRHPEATLEFTASDPDETGLVKITVALICDNRVGEPAKPISLSFWRESTVPQGGDL